MSLKLFPNLVHVYLMDSDKENKCLSLNDAASPPLSARIRALSNNLKSLCVSTESSLKIAQDSSIRNQVIDEIFEPKTPVSQQCITVDDTHEITNIASPWENFQMRGSGMKVSVSVHHPTCLLYTSPSPRD